MVKYVITGKITKAILKDCEYDAARRIAKRFRAMVGDSSAMVFAPLIEKSLMRNKYSGTVNCDDRDNYDEVAGKQMALEKAEKNYKDGVKRAIKRWQKAMLRVIESVSEETFEESLEEYKKAKEK